MGKRILVVDDEKLIVKGIRFSLEQEGMEVDCAYDGEEALEYAKACEYDLVLLDVMLPKLDGFQVCQQIREFSDMPVVMLTAKSEDIQETKDELAGAKEREAQQYADMKVRIQFMYENGQTSYLEALLSSRNISEFLNSADYIAQIQSYDRQKLTEYQDTVESIVNLEAQLEQEYTDLEALKSTVESNKATVAAMMRQKESELADISGDIEDAQSDADYYAAEIQAQEELIAAIKRAEAEKAAAGVEEHPYTGGAFRWPCPSSTRVTSDYGTRVSPMSGASSNHKGIDIGASAGADIIAAADGTVTAASYSSAAGNYVMIDHGGGLYTVYMHASSLLVSPGQTVSAGDVIAKVGSTGISTGSHLHFGVSLNGSYVSPWSYLGG